MDSFLGRPFTNTQGEPISTHPYLARDKARWVGYYPLLLISFENSNFLKGRVIIAFQFELKCISFQHYPFILTFEYANSHL